MPFGPPGFEVVPAMWRRSVLPAPLLEVLSGADQVVGVRVGEGVGLAWGGPGGWIIGGAYRQRLRNPDLKLLGWKIPAWLAGLYEIHDGIGPAFDPRPRWLPFALLPWGECEPLTKRVRFGEENVLYDPADAVMIAPDNRGGGWVLIGRDQTRVARWDGETHRMGPQLEPVAMFEDLAGHWAEQLGVTAPA